MERRLPNVSEQSVLHHKGGSAVLERAEGEADHPAAILLLRGRRRLGGAGAQGAKSRRLGSRAQGLPMRHDWIVVVYD